LDKIVALKLLDPVAGESSRTWDEARLLENLGSRCLVGVLNADIDSQSDIRFIVTPLLTGGDLEALAKSVGLGLHQAVRLIRHVAAGVDRIHAEGMVHRDIKPGNVLVEGDDVLVSDLGYCAIMDADGTAEGNGTWQTVAPEVASFGRCSILSDVYSLGATAFYALSGEYPVSIRMEIAKQVELIKAGKLRGLRDLAPHVPQSVATVVRKALKLVPQDRYRSAEEFANALAGSMDGRRDWVPTPHDGHMFCVRGEPFNSRAGVTICGETEEMNIRVVTRHEASGRRVKGHPDAVVRHDGVPKEFRRIVAELS
jgi:serine/threonine-protein kinase